MVVEATMEEQVLKIREVIKVFRVHTRDLQFQNMPRMTPEVREGIKIMGTTTVSNIKMIE
jgi:hypothetical protein